MAQIAGETVLIDRYPYTGEPKVTPVAEARVRNHLQLSHNDDDQIVFGVAGYIHDATQEVENRGNVSLIRQKRRLVLEVDVCLDKVSIALPYGPVTSILGVYYLDVDGVQQTLPGTAYRASLLGATQSITFNSTVPSLLEGPGNLWVEYETGFGTAWEQVPASWVGCVLIMAMRLYERREGTTGNIGADTAWERSFDRKIVAAGGNRRYA